MQEWQISQLCYEVDVEPYAQTRDAAINQLAAQAGVAVAPFVSHTLYVSEWQAIAVIHPLYLNAFLAIHSM
jgi:deoxyribodipyrimidine photolyase